MKEIKVDILEIITNVIEDYNKNKPNGLQEFLIEDFYLLDEYCKIYGNVIEVHKFISFCTKEIWIIYSNSTFNKTLWDYKLEDFNYLEIMTNKLSRIISSFDLLFQNGFYEQSLVIFRSFQELSSVFILTIIEKDFFLKYVTVPSDQDEYKRYWFSYLRPEKVKNSINNINTNSQYDYLEFIKSRLAGIQRDLIYSHTSDISHGKFLDSIIVPFKSEILHLIIDYMCHVTMMIHVINYNNLEYKTPKHETILIVYMGVWIKILYNNLQKK